MFILVAGLTFNMWEYFPQNSLLMFLWGSVLGTAGSLAVPVVAGLPHAVNLNPVGIFSRDRNI